AESVVEDVVPVVSLASSYASYLEGLGKKARHEIRRKLRKIKSRKDIRLRRIGEPQALQRALPVFIELHRREGPEKQAFWKAAGMEDFFLTATLSLAEEAKAFLDVLEAGDRMIAGLLSFRETDVVFLYNVAFDREFSSLSPGIALFHHVIQQAISEGATSVDFLKGREKYKYDFGAKDSTIYRLILKRTE
ncbi:MAG: GNAT family N-acetyltransferase, partial [Candidatus Aminicenantales bacterium]